GSARASSTEVGRVDARRVPPLRGGLPAPLLLGGLPGRGAAGASGAAGVGVRRPGAGGVPGASVAVGRPVRCPAVAGPRGGRRPVARTGRLLAGVLRCPAGRAPGSALGAGLRAATDALGCSGSLILTGSGGVWGSVPGCCAVSGAVGRSGPLGVSSGAVRRSVPLPGRGRRGR